jgi:hypothetical protein
MSPSAPPVAPARRFYTLFYAAAGGALRIAADIFRDKNVITRPHGKCNDGPAAAELK